MEMDQKLNKLNPETTVRSNLAILEEYALFSADLAAGHHHSLLP